MNDKYNFLTVSQINEYIKMLFDSNPVLKNVYIKGEISNFNYQYKTGHMYFTLKDESSMISVAMFASYAQRLNFKPSDGMKVIVRGRISTYTQRGVYQIYADEMQPDGVGALSIAYEQLRRKLEAEGLFAIERKRPLPAVPEKIGIITSPTGAAIRDMINILGRRFPAVEVTLYPSLVQGDGAPEQLVRGLECFNSRYPVDLIIIGRGGGSIEDLWAFNDERVVRAVAGSAIPVISAVGHESDVTLCDFAADMRAPTPSAAAELAVPQKEKFCEGLGAELEHCSAILERKTASYRNNLKYLSDSGALSVKTRIFDGRKNSILNLSGDIERLTDKIMTCAKSTLAGFSSKLTALNPLGVLARGYAAVTDADNTVIIGAEQLKAGQSVSVRLAKGAFDAEVTEITKEIENG